MERKSSVKDVHQYIKQDYSELYTSLCSKLGEINPFAKFSIGAGDYVWSDNRCQWHRMTDASELKQSIIHESLNHIREEVAGKIGTKTAEALFTIPDASYIYYNDDDDEIRVLVTGWGFKKPVRIKTAPDTSSLNKKNPVSISFSYDGVRLENYEFGLRLAKQVKRLTTGTDGLFHFDNLKVGERYVVTDINSGEDFVLNIIEGQSLYDYDVTRYSVLSVSATCNGLPIKGEKVEISYHGKQYDMVTDEDGRARFQLPFYGGEVATASMRDKSENAQISETGENIEFIFITEKEHEEMVDPEVPSGEDDEPILPANLFNPHILVQRENGEIADNYPLSVEYAGDTNEYSSNSAGIVPLSEIEGGRSMVVTDGNNPDNTEEYILDTEQDEYVFIVPDEESEMPKEIKVMFRNLEGNPIECKSVIFRQECAPDLEVQLDDDGNTCIDEGTFKFNSPISVQINGWTNEEQYSPIPVTFEENEYEYLLQEREPRYLSSWKKLLPEIFIVLVVAALLWLLWPYFEYFCQRVFEKIYY